MMIKKFGALLLSAVLCIGMAAPASMKRCWAWESAV